MTPSSNVSFMVSALEVYMNNMNTGPQCLLKLFCNHGKSIPMSLQIMFTRVKEMKGYQANFHGSNVKAKTIQVTY